MNEKPELSPEPVEGEVMPVGKIPTVTVSENKALIVLAKAKKIDVLASDDAVVGMVSELKSFFAGDIEGVKKAVATITTKAGLTKEDEKRLVVYRIRQGFKADTDAFLSGQKALLKSAADGKKKIETALSDIEDGFSEILAGKKAELEAEASRKKALADSMAKLKSHVINALLPSADIEAAIDDFSLAFGNSDYQESQDAAEAVFESKMAEFETILAAAVAREENERKIKEQEEQARQRANITVTFPIVEISGNSVRSSVDIQSRIEWTDKVDMSAFNLVLSEAENAKQSCLSMLNVFLTAAVAREAAEKQYQDDWDAAIQESNDRLAWESEIVDTAVAEDIAAIITEPCLERLDSEAEPCNDGVCVGGLELTEVSSVVNDDDCVLIPVRHLKALIDATSNGLAFYDYDDGEVSLIDDAIAFAKSLI